MRIAWKIFRAVVSVLLLLLVLLPVSVYVLLSIEPVQNRIRAIAATELSRTLGADISIGKVLIHPFNRLSVSDVCLSIKTDTLASVNHVSAGFELNHFLRTGELVIDYALVDGADIRINRADDNAPLNIQPIIDHLRSDEPKEEKAFELRINTVVLRNASLAYDVFSAAEPDSGRFNAKHIAVNDLAINAYIPQISNNRYRVHLDHLSFDERSGFSISALQAKADFGRDGARLYDFSLDLPSSHLEFDPIELRYDGYSDIRPALNRENVHIATEGVNTIYLPDLSAFSPALGKLDCLLALDLCAEGSLSSLDLRTLAIRDARGGALSLLLTGSGHDLLDKEKLSFSLTRGALNVDGREIVSICRHFLPAKTATLLAKIPDFTLGLSGEGTLAKGYAHIHGLGTPGEFDIAGDYTRHGASTSFTGQISTEGLQLDLLTGNTELGKLSATLEGTANKGRHLYADFNAQVDEFEFKGYSYTGFEAELKIENEHKLEANLSLDDPNGHLQAYAFYENTEGAHSLNATATASGIDFNALGFDKKHEGYRFAAKMNVSASGKDIDDLAGTAAVYDIRWLDRAGHGLKLSKFKAEAAPNDPEPTVKIESDILRGTIHGEYSFTTIGEQLRDMAASFLPALFDTDHEHKRQEKIRNNDFSFDFTLLPSQEVTEFLGLPVHVLYDVDIEGRIDSRNGRASVNVSAPYLRQGNKLLENTDIFAALDTTAADSRVYITSQFPTKKGDMAVSTLLRTANNRIDTHVDWTIERAIPLNGTIDFSTLLRGKPGKKGDATFPVDARIDFNPGTINFGDEVWKIQTSSVDISPMELNVDNFRLDAGTQSIDIDGTIGAAETDSLQVHLDHIALLPIFETLQIDNALIGGRATGTFTARDLLGGEPFFACPALHVDSIGYQRCTIGDADIRAGWDNPTRSFYLDADITGLEGRESKIKGNIMPFDEALDIDFYADSIPVDFLKPFMIAFTSSITGRASGHCRLFGTFKDIDLEGDVMADNVKLKVDFTGTSYIATDSVHIRPGVIELNNLTIRDTEGHTALLNGRVEHTCFHEPVFRFDITQARDFLSYNIGAKENPDWYGTIYGNGGASISGYPGVVNINVAMSTAPRSTFTFVLSDRLDAEDYSFITFRDVTPDSLRTRQEVTDDTPEAVKAFKNRGNTLADSPSQYNMDIRVDITKEAAMTLVMDPVGGDEIKAHGDGNLHLAYSSGNNDLNIWGKYTLAEGSYRFTLQDIIIKDFTIKEGSEIQFDGDPYGVKTKLEAYYATNANLTDLDESFLQDKDIARTNVPVHALMKVTGDIRQPSIDFDLEFPTLTSDTYRKVRSIVSTSDMMNRQIIYLLALNRFYTPDYMASTTKGSELFSVASSTISSQLGNLLGKLSDKWSIAPNLRSDRGDFSDVEVDVALSSRLLNNRLIFNGNFGYRDKTLNSNQFIGDFDIEYLLNKRGTWRLKAYNRYNDRNYYIRSAQTTQGLGIMFRRDFDSFLSFLRKLRPQKKQDSEDIKDQSSPKQ